MGRLSIGQRGRAGGQSATVERSMPLVTCPDCQKDVSDRAPACIHCGRPLRAAAAEPQAVRAATGASGGNVLAALLSLFVPGLGQLVQGRLARAGACFLVEGIAAVLAVFFLALASQARDAESVAVVPFIGIMTFAFHLWQVYDAATYEGR